LVKRVTCSEFQTVQQALVARVQADHLLLDQDLQARHFLLRFGPQKCSGQYALPYRFEYLDHDWPKNPKIRQLVLQATFWPKIPWSVPGLVLAGALVDSRLKHRTLRSCSPTTDLDELFAVCQTKSS